jgi:hypothetical protein
MKTVIRPRLRNAGARSDGGGKKRGPGRRSQVSVDGGGRGSGGERTWFSWRLPSSLWRPLARRGGLSVGGQLNSWTTPLPFFCLKAMPMVMRRYTFTVDSRSFCCPSVTDDPFYQEEFYPFV